MTEPLGGTTRYQYDELNALLAVDETPRADSTTAAGVTRFRYDANRNRVAQQDAEIQLVTYTFDALNRMTGLLQHTVPGTLGNAVSRRASPGGNPATALRWTFGHDPNGNVSSLDDPRGQHVGMTYDWLDRLTNRTYSAHADTTTGRPADFQPLRIAFTYDGNGNLLEAVETKQLGAGAVTERSSYAYDGLDRPSEFRRYDHDAAVPRWIQCAYDIVGNRREVTDPDGRVTRYTFDDRNRLKTVVTEATTAPLTTSYQWWEDSLLKRVDFPGGMRNDRGGVNAYDRADRVLRITHTNTAAGLTYSTFEYEYDANGNRLVQVERQPELTPSMSTNHYAYDRLNRLRQVDYDGRSVTYTLSASGNRLAEIGIDAVSGAPLNRSYVYGADPARPVVTYSGVNALARIDDNLHPVDSILFEYDRNLNQVAKIRGGDRREFHFNIRDELGAAAVGGAQVRFDYDPNGMRVKKLGAVETRYLYDQAAVLVEYGASADAFATRRKYDYSYELLGSTELAGAAAKREFYLKDGLMSTANLVGSGGAISQSYRYDAWGRVLAQDGASTNPRQFTGQYRDSETGLQYFGARYYDEELGRFISQNPSLGDALAPPSLHRYLYAHANPLGYIDDDGRSATLVGATAGFFWGFGQMVGTMVLDVRDTHYRDTWDYLAIWGRNVYGGAAMGASIDIGAGGPLTWAASGAMGGSGWDALTFGGGTAGVGTQNFQQFMASQTEGIETGAAAGVLFGFAGEALGLAGRGIAALMPETAEAATFGARLLKDKVAGVAQNVVSRLSGQHAAERALVVAEARERIALAVSGEFRERAMQTELLATKHLMEDQARLAQGLLSPAGIPDEGAFSAAVTELEDTFLGRTMQSAEVPTEVSPTVGLMHPMPPGGPGFRGGPPQWPPRNIPPPGSWNAPPPAQIVSDVYRTGGRPFVFVELPSGERQAFYRSSGVNSHRPDQWLPFDGLDTVNSWALYEHTPGLNRQRIMVEGAEGREVPVVNVNQGWFNKAAYSGRHLPENHPLHRFGTEQYREISRYLGQELSHVRQNHGIPILTPERGNEIFNLYGVPRSIVPQDLYEPGVREYMYPSPRARAPTVPGR